MGKGATYFNDDAIETGASQEESSTPNGETYKTKTSQNRTCRVPNFVLWTCRNAVHVVLLVSAVLSLGYTTTLSMDSCSVSTENVTETYQVQENFTIFRNVTRNVTVYTNVTSNITVTEIVPLSAYFLVDASQSMSWSSAAWDAENGGCEPNSGSCTCPPNATCQETNGNSFQYIISDGDINGTINPSTMFSCAANGDLAHADSCNGTTPNKVTAVSKAFDPDAEGDRFDKAKVALPYIMEALDGSLNNASMGASGNLHMGILQWAHDDRGVIIQSDLTDNVADTIAANNAMVLNGGPNTCWAPGLCQCYSRLKDQATTKLCILVSDGGLYPNTGTGCAYDAPRYDRTTGAGVKSKNNTIIPNAGGFCADVYEDWSSIEGNTGLMSHENVGDFLKSQNISIYGILASSYSVQSAQNVFSTASCDSYAFPGDAATECPYYARVDNFDQLINKASEIAAYQLTIAQTEATKTLTSTESSVETESETVANTSTVVTTQESVTASDISICDLTFLYGLGAFAPFLSYLLYRLLTILAKRKPMRKAILEMIKKNASVSKWGVAGTTTRVLLPNASPSDVDFGITWLLFSCLPCLLPVARDDFVYGGATTFAL